MQLTVIIPTYNEAENIAKMVSAVIALPIPDLKLLVIDDNSPDGTAKIVEELSEQHPGRIRVHKRPGKMGLGPAYLTGFQLAFEDGADAVAQMDADFSHPPEKLVELLAALDYCDVALGSRYVPGGQVDERWPVWRHWLSGFGNFYARTILRLPIRDVTGGFRVWRRETLQSLPLDQVRSNGYVFQVELAYLTNRLGFTLKEIPIYFADRRWGESKMSLKIQIEAAVRTWVVLYNYRNLKPLKGEPESLSPS